MQSGPEFQVREKAVAVGIKLSGPPVLHVRRGGPAPGRPVCGSQGCKGLPNSGKEAKNKINTNK